MQKNCLLACSILVSVLGCSETAPKSPPEPRTETTESDRYIGELVFPTTDGKIRSMQVVGDHVYFHQNGKSKGTIKRVTVDGHNPQTLYTQGNGFVVEGPYTDGENVFWQEPATGNPFYRFDVKAEKTEEFLNVSENFIPPFFDDEYAYFFGDRPVPHGSGKMELTRFPKAGGKPEKIGTAAKDMFMGTTWAVHAGNYYRVADIEPDPDHSELSTLIVSALSGNTAEHREVAIYNRSQTPNTLTPKLQVANDTLYFVQRDGLRSMVVGVDLSAQNGLQIPKPVSSTQISTNRFHVDKDRLYFSGKAPALKESVFDSNPAIYTQQIGSNEIKMLAFDNGAHSVATDATHVYWVNHDGIYRTPKDGSRSR